MCGIVGWIDWEENLNACGEIIDKMIDTLSARGPDDRGKWLTGSAALGHRRLAVVDIEKGKQPMSRVFVDRTYTITYNGELYNTEEIRNMLLSKGYSFSGHSDTEVLLLSYVEWGTECLSRLNGIFAFAIWDSEKQRLFMARDRLGVKPLFYKKNSNFLLFASELKALLVHPSVSPEVDLYGLAEIFLIGPARTPGNGVFKNIDELKPGYYLLYDRKGCSIRPYWKLAFREHEDDFKTTLEKVRYLFVDSVESQLVSDVPLGTLLSGGLDSSLISAVAAKFIKKRDGLDLPTFSVDYTDNDKYFKPNSYQPNSDKPWVEKVSDYLETNHHYIYFNTEQLIKALEDAVLARDLPGMADVDSSLLLFSQKIKEKVTVALSGECADEVFGGYPWFHRDDSRKAETFPWAMDLDTRLKVLAPDLLSRLNPYDYIKERYSNAINEVPLQKGLAQEEIVSRKIGYLTLTRFMPTLLDRKDRMTMAAGLEVRVPFCDHRLVSYVWNIPWQMKNFSDREKGLLRAALKGMLPQDVMWRKKSPYPKTHNPEFTQIVTSKLIDILRDNSSPVQQLVNKKQILELAVNAQARIDKPWFGQLMDLTRMFAYLIQTDFWLRKYSIKVSV